MAVRRLAGLTKATKEIVEEGYYKTIYEIQREFDISDAFDVLEPSTVEDIRAKPWAPDGKGFSERIWEDRDRLVNELERELTHSFIRGDSPDQAINNIARAMNVSKKNTGRLVMTESAYLASISRLQAYKQTGVKEYQILATLDLRTPEICQEMDGRVFKVSEYEPGVTANHFIHGVGQRRFSASKGTSRVGSCVIQQPAEGKRRGSILRTRSGTRSTLLTGTANKLRSCARRFKVRPATSSSTSDTRTSRETMLHSRTFTSSRN